jgi:SNF2 family DNA or RNA helicase
MLNLAHMIRNSSTKLFGAVSRLSAAFRWCLTGTPVQNSLEDLASLMAFIRASPLDNIPGFRQHIIHPLIKGMEQGFENLRLLLESSCLRRTKKLLNLPDFITEDHILDFSDAEKLMYSATQIQMIEAIRRHDIQAKDSEDYVGIFHLQLQLRRLCNHGTYQKALPKHLEDEISFDPEAALTLLQSQRQAKCICCDLAVVDLDSGSKTSGTFTVCGHLLCMDCVPRCEVKLSKAGEDKLRCSICAKSFKGLYIASKTTAVEYSCNTVSSTSYFEQSGISSKVNTLVHDIKENYEDKRFLPTNAYENDKLTISLKHCVFLLDQIPGPRWKISRLTGYSVLAY